MSRLRETFADLAQRGQKGFIPFVSAGDPDLETSLAIVRKLADLGAAVIELGVPFSDPMADGPAIQRSSQRALAAGTDLTKILDMVGRLRETSDVPIVLFSYLNPLLRFGIDRLCERARTVGVDGVLITDVVGNEARAISRTLRTHGIDLISLIAPTTSEMRIREIAGSASGFIYAVSRAGVTGARSDVSDEARALVERARRCTDLPIAVGFGISTAAQVADVWEYADAAVVGSAIVSVIESSAGVESPVDAVDRFVRGLVPQIAKQP